MASEREERRKSMLTDRDIELLSNLMRSGEKKILGFRIPELVMLFSLLLGVFAFYIRTDDAIIRLIKLTEYTDEFMKNSDLYHTEILGIRFKQGKPENGDIDLSRVRNVLNGGNSKGTH